MRCSNCLLCVFCLLYIIVWRLENLHLLCVVGLVVGFIVIERSNETLPDFIRHQLLKVEHESKRGQRGEEAAADERDHGDKPYPSVDGRWLLLGHLAGSWLSDILELNATSQRERESVAIHALIDPANGNLDGAKLSNDLEVELLLF